MKVQKKILSILLKAALGLGCLLIVYFKLSGEFHAGNFQLLQSTLVSLKSMIHFLVCLLCIPLNWGLESYKWQLITAPVERITFQTASKSIYSGICVGNFAPGRATEFLGKIFFFSDANKPKITVLHFVNGMIQLSITLLSGLAALLLTLQHFNDTYPWLGQLFLIVSIALLCLFAFAIFRINKLLHFITRFISKKNIGQQLEYSFSKKLLFILFLLSICRYIVFSTQFFLLLHLFNPKLDFIHFLPGIALYFFITSTVPMISFLEAAIRATIALLVFKNSGLPPAAVALSTVLLWFMNIVLPSIAGYFVLLRQKFDFKFIKLKKG